MTFTNKLKALRAGRNMRQGDMAELLHISKNAYNMKELGKTEFTMSEINIILNFFNVKYEDIFLSSRSN